MSVSPSSIILAPLAVLVMAVVHPEPNNALDLSGLAAMISAGVGVIGFVAASFKHRSTTKITTRRANEAQEAASYVEGFNALIARLQEEIEDLRHTHESEHEIWMQERAELQITIEKLKLDLLKAQADGLELRGQLQELRGQIKGFLNQQQYEEFKKHLRP